MSTEVRWLIRDGESRGAGERVSGSSTQPDPQKTEEAMDHHQNNKLC